MNLTSSSHLGIPNRFWCQQMPCTGRNGCLLVVRIRFAIFTIVRLIPQSRDWETNCASAPPVVRGREGLTFTFNFRGYLVLIFPNRTTIESVKFCFTHSSIHTPLQGIAYIIFNNKKLFCHRPMHRQLPLCMCLLFTCQTLIILSIYIKSR